MLFLLNTWGFFIALVIQGWLPGLRAEGDTSMLPTIAVVASYDTFGAAPVSWKLRILGRYHVVYQYCGLICHVLQISGMSDFDG
jgi:hypothetical protein